MRNRVVSALLTCVLLLSLSGCAVFEKSDDDRPSVVCSVFPAYDFVRQIAGDHINVSLLLDPGQECHSYEPTPRDILDIQESDVFVYVGGESEAWVADILSSIGSDGPRALTLMDCVDVVEEELTEGMESEEEESGEVAYDEHVWTSPRNAVQIVAKLTDALCALDAENATDYRTAAETYKAQLNALDEQFRDAVANATHRTLVFADRFPFRYFADTYGLDYFAAFPGCSDSAEPSAATVAFLIDKVKAESIPAVLYIEFSTQSLANTVCEATGAQKRLFHSCHNVTADELRAGATYLSLMTDNLTVLKEALA